ncbi:MAG: hypothetical protein V3U65_17320 [Granulosicoccaceae bacterium]
MASSLMASTALAGVSALAMELYDASGLRQQIAMIPAQTERSFDIIALSETMPLEFESLDRKAMRDAVPQSFSEARLQSEMIKALESVNEPHLQRMVQWFDSELGAKVKRAELENSLLSNQDRFVGFREALLDDPVSDNRKRLAERLDDSLRISESAADTVINVQIGFTLSIMSAAGSPINVEDYAQSIKANRAYIVESYRADSIETILFIYQGLSDGELSRYADSMHQQAARQFIDASNSGIANGMLAASSTLGTAIGSMFVAVPSEPGI